MDNPYQSSPVNPLASTGGEVTPGVIQALAGTKPWVRFLSILGFIGTGLMLLGGVFMLIGAGFLSSAFASNGAAAPFGGFPLAGMAILYILMAILYLFPSIKLWKYGTHILTLMGSRSMSDLEAALDAQRSFWKFVGIMAAIVIGIYIVIIAIAMVAGVAGAMNR